MNNALHGKNSKLRIKILEMAKLDQDARRNYREDSSLLAKVLDIDKANLVQMKRITKDFGWPTASLVSKRASHMSWLLVQHADSDVKFQEYCLDLMKKSLKNNEVSKKDIAYLSDRIAVNKGKPQIYGTQFYKNKKKQLVPRPITDIKNLEKRRKEADLESFETYKKKIS